MYAATRKTSLGNHGIKDFVHAGFYQKQKPAPIDLWTEKPIRLVEQNVDIRTVLEKYIKPGVYLTLLRDSKKEAEFPTTRRIYKLSHIDIKQVPSTRIKKGTHRARGSSEFHIIPGNSAHFSHCMYMAWHKLNSGMNVEFQIHQGGRKKGQPPDAANFRKMMEENLHLRPDVIGKAMPEFSSTIVEPQTNWIKICWVIGPPAKTKDGSMTTAL